MGIDGNLITISSNNVLTKHLSAKNIIDGNLLHHTIIRRPFETEFVNERIRITQYIIA